MSWSQTYRFTYQSGNYWYWQAHGKSSKRKASEADAVRELSTLLGVPKAALKKRAKPVHKESSTAGVSWHAGKLGWVLRSGKYGSSFTEKESAAKLKATGTEVQSVGRPPLKRTRDLQQKSMFKHVVYHKQKEAFRIIHPQYWGGELYSSDYEAVCALAEELEIEAEELLKFGKVTLPCVL